MNNIFSGPGTAVLVLLVFMVGAVSAQNEKDQLRRVKIKLTNGAVLKGYIGRSIDENSITLIPDGDTTNAYNLGFRYIRSMNFGKSKMPEPEERDLIKKYQPDDKGFYHALTMGLGMGEEHVHLILGNENGYRFTDHFAGGLGIDYERYPNISSLPLYLKFRGYLTNKRVSPFYFLGGGYAFSWDNGKEHGEYTVTKIKGGLYGQVGVGYQIRTGETAISFNLGYKIQTSRLDYEYQYYMPGWSSIGPYPSENMLVQEKRQIRRIFLSFSVVF